MNDPIRVPLLRLTRRVRWKRWLGKLHRFLWAFVICFSLLFVADFAFGLSTLSLRIIGTGLVLTAIAALTLDWMVAWLTRLDPLGLAHLLEQRFPKLSERLVTLLQMGTASAHADHGMVALMKAQTEKMLASVTPEDACPLDVERKLYARTGVLFALLFAGLLFTPGFAVFGQRLACVWATPLVPYEIELAAGRGYVLRGQSLTIEALVRVVDPFAAAPKECSWQIEDSGELLPMKALGEGRFAIVVDNVQTPMRGRAVVGEAQSEPLSVAIVEMPALVGRPTATCEPLQYVRYGPKTIHLDDDKAKSSVLQYSKISYRIALDRAPASAVVNLTVKPATKGAAPIRQAIPLVCRTDGTMTGESIALASGESSAELVLTLEHGVAATLPLGHWRVHADGPPRFGPLRFHGSAAPLLSSQEHTITPDDALRLQTEVVDDEGLAGVAIEFRVNGKAMPVRPWLQGVGVEPLKIDHWLPLPGGVKDGDRVEFRLHASDRRSLLKGAIVASPPQPATDLGTQLTIAPAPTSDDGSWIHLRVDRGRDAFAKQQAVTQRDETRDLIGKIKAKLADEAQQTDALKKMIHRQAALTQEQRREGDKLRALNRSITEDLLDASKQPELGRLAGHFLDLAETELKKSDDALKRFTDTDRTLAEAEMDLAEAVEALNAAQRKLERMLEWNDRLTQDRLDQAQLESLAKRQQDLADRLEKLRASEAPSEAERARQIEEIRQEQARLAAEADQLKDKNRLVQESMAAAEQKRAEQLAQGAEKLAADQRAMRELTAEKPAPEMQERLDELAKRQASLADRVTPYAAKNDGPDVTPARTAALALAKVQLAEAIDQQKAHEKRLQTWIHKLFPDEIVNEQRQQVLGLVQMQRDIRADLEKLGRDFPQLDEKAVQKRMQDLTARARAVHAAVAKLGSAFKDAAQRAPQQAAEQSAEQAAGQLAAKDALAALESLEKTQQHLEALAGLLPKTLAQDRSEIKDVTLRGRVEQIDRFKTEQEKIRQDTERLLADATKAIAAKEGAAAKDKAQQLAKELLELAQKGTSPEAKAMAKAGAEAVDMAQKAMQASDDAKGKGDADAAKMFDEEAAKQLEMAAKMLQKFTQDPTKKDMAKDDGKTAEAIKESSTQMKIAEANLPKMTKEAQAAMQAAADKLADAVQQASKQSAARLPESARNPSTQASLMPGGSSRLPKDFKLDADLQKKWGELPGELKTRMLQDFRARYGDDHAELIRRYFERVAQATPARKE